MQTQKTAKSINNQVKNSFLLPSVVTVVLWKSIADNLSWEIMKNNSHKIKQSIFFFSLFNNDSLMLNKRNDKSVFALSLPMDILAIISKHFSHRLIGSNFAEPPHYSRHSRRFETHLWNLMIIISMLLFSSRAIKFRSNGFTFHKVMCIYSMIGGFLFRLV